ncbi:MAG TPA: thiolase family protein, partial [Acidimicrobiia bacterium]
MSVALAGLGITEMGKVFGSTPSDFAAEAIRLAVADAGLTFGDLDGLLLNPGVSHGALGIELAAALGLRDLSLLALMNGYGSSAGAMVQTAALAVDAGMADTVACVFADAPVEPGRNIGWAFSGLGASQPKGFGSLAATTGIPGVAGLYGFAARRHMAAYGTNEEHFAAVAVNQR